MEDALIMNFKSSVAEASTVVPTKRHVLKIMARIYDPLGFIQPLIVTLKLLFQTICVSGIGWDEVFNDELSKEFFDVIEDISRLGELIIPRCYYSADPKDPITKVTLHAFSDGFKVAYGGCIYLKVATKSGFIKVSFVVAKSRVVPSGKTLTVPQLELLGNLVTSRLVGNVIGALEAELFINKVFYWSDSKISLAWIKSINKEFKPFIENRLVEIRKNVGINDWYCRRSEVNPVDLISRSGNDINSKMWFNGPEFLHQPMGSLEAEPCCDVTADPEYVNELHKSNLVLLAAQGKSNLIGNIIDIKRYNDYLKLLRVTGYVLRFVNNLKSKSSLVLSKYLTVTEISEAKRLWIVDNQGELKGDKFNDLKVSLNLQHDKNGLIRSYSRLKKAKIPYDAKAPIFINKNHKLAEILVYYAHLKVITEVLSRH